MRATFLGTGAGMPSKLRNVSSWALSLDDIGEIWLFDCGEGTQHQLQRSDLRSGRIRRIFITHLHGDHIFGLPGLLTSLSMSGAVNQVDLYGPEGLEAFVTTAVAVSASYLDYELVFHVVAEPGEILSTETFSVHTAPLVHRVPAFGYRVQEIDRPGRFDADRAAELGVATGPDFGRLKRGETVTLEDGSVIDGSELVGPARPGRSVTYCTDTSYAPTAVELARKSTMLIHEATFSSENEEGAAKWGHSTTSTAARVAAEADVEQLVMTHFSARYTPAGPVTIDDLLAQARAIFPNTEAASDLATFSIERE